MARKKSWKSGEIKSVQTFSYQNSTAFNSNVTFSINAVDTSHTVVQSTSAYDTANGVGSYVNDVLLRTRQVYLNTSTQLIGQARNSVGSSGSLTSAGAGQVVEYYA
jgi:hypothetical protein